MSRTHSRELKGRKFGRLRVVGETDQRAINGCIIWECACKCGGVARVITSNLTTGNTVSCGCVQRARSRKANRKGGVRWVKTAGPA